MRGLLRHLLLVSQTCSKIATPDERLLAAAREDNEEMLLSIFEAGDIDINYQDGYVLLFYCSS